jgi:hypothetical protein
MAKLTSASRNSLPSNDFVFPGQRKFPIPDRSHGANAKARAAQSGNPAVKAKVDAAVNRKFPGIGKKKKKSNNSSLYGGM